MNRGPYRRSVRFLGLVLCWIEDDDEGREFPECRLFLGVDLWRSRGVRYCDLVWHWRRNGRMGTGRLLVLPLRTAHKMIGL